MDSDSNWVRAGKAADLLKVTPRQVLRLAHAGKIRSKNPLFGWNLYSREDIQNIWWQRLNQIPMNFDDGNELIEEYEARQRAAAVKKKSAEAA